MTSLTCPTHGLPWKRVPAGVSKATGIPYLSFEACPERGCSQRPTAAPPVAPRTSPVPQSYPDPKVVPGASSGPSERLLLIIACMDFASRVFQTSENDIAARSCAHDAFEGWKDQV